MVKNLDDVKFKFNFLVFNYFEVENLNIFRIIFKSKLFRYVLQKYTFLDNKKIGIWGKGYGGYTAASLMGAKPVSNLVFKCGAALSPIARFSNLSHTFFHRYFPPLTNPWESTDPLIYTRVDILHRIRAIRNNSFLLMHGALQRDVPLEQSMWLSEALLKANVTFEQTASILGR